MECNILFYVFIFIDNAAIHHTRDVVDALNATGALVVFLPPYSPDYTLQILQNLSRYFFLNSGKVFLSKDLLSYFEIFYFDIRISKLCKKNYLP